MRISVDAMGGDHAPAAVVQGCVEALSELDIHITLTGPKELLEKELKKYEFDSSRIDIIHCSEVISPNEHPVMAIRKKKNSSICEALRLVKSKECDAVISAGSTGALLAGALLLLAE